MKKIVLLSAFILIGSSIVSCDNDQDQDASRQSFATDDGFTPIKPPPPPPPTLPPGSGIGHP